MPRRAIGTWVIARGRPSGRCAEYMLAKCAKAAISRQKRKLLRNNKPGGGHEWSLGPGAAEPVAALPSQRATAPIRPCGHGASSRSAARASSSSRVLGCRLRDTVWEPYGPSTSMLTTLLTA